MVYIKILICTDGSKYSEQGVERAGYLLKDIKPKVTLIRVIPQLGEEYREFPEYYQMFRDEFQKVQKKIEAAWKKGIPESIKSSLDYSKGFLESIGIEVEIKVKRGKASDKILKEIEEDSYSLVVVSSYGEGLSKSLVGSVTREIVHHSPIPVMVMKPE